MGVREEPRLFFANRPSRTPAFVNSPNLFTDGAEVEVRAFDHSGGELHYLLCRETLLRNESADNHLTDTELSSGLLHGDPQPLIWWWTGRKAVCMADMLHALLRPSVAVASATAQPVQDRNNRRVFTD
jgi:hypothetical protein